MKRDSVFLLLGCKETGKSAVLRGLTTNLRLDHDRRVTVALRKGERRITVNSNTVIIKSAPLSQLFLPYDADQNEDTLEPYILYFASREKTEFAAQATFSIAKYNHDIDEMRRLIHMTYPVRQPKDNMYVIPFQPTIEAKINIVAGIINRCIGQDLFMEY